MKTEEEGEGRGWDCQISSTSSCRPSWKPAFPPSASVSHPQLLCRSNAPNTPWLARREGTVPPATKRDATRVGPASVLYSIGSFVNELFFKKQTYSWE